MMSFTRNAQGELLVENVALAEIANTHGTPLYVYSRSELEKNYLAFTHAFADVPHQVCFAVKANSNIGVLSVLAKLGAGFDIVSIGELHRVLAAGGAASKVVFSGLGKSEADIAFALEQGIACFNVESHAELDRIQTVAKKLDKKAPVSLRVNPDVDAKTHPYISTGLKENKFGIASDKVLESYRHAAGLSHLEVVGIDCHIGSQLTETQPFTDALARILGMITALKNEGINLKHIDIGGGLGVCYKDETPPTPQQYAGAMLPTLKELGLKVYMEPGRAIAANAGVLLTKVDILKPTAHKNFAVVDAAMNDLIRPSLYGAYMDIVPIQKPPAQVAAQTWDVVGAVCETGDWLGKDRKLALTPDTLLAVTGAGAYGFVMASNYNTRPKAAEVLVDGDVVHLVRQREKLADLWANECLVD